MKATTSLLLAACGIGAACLGAGKPHSEQWPVREQETINRVMQLNGDPMRLVVENVDGFVHVTGGAGGNVRVRARKTIRAESDADWQEAKREVKLDFEEKPGSAAITYDAPWICRGQTSAGQTFPGQTRACDSGARRFYEVTYDIEIETPFGTRPVLSTVNNGDIQVERTTGNFEVSDINGGIRMKQVAGSGEVKTINGPVEVEFAKNPDGATSFKSINGPLHVTFQRGLAADVQFKTFNGEVFSDFDVAPRLNAGGQAEQKNGRFVYRSNGMKGGRVGQGGPELSFDTLNGSVYLHAAR